MKSLIALLLLTALSVASAMDTKPVSSAQIIKVTVTSNGFEPAQIKVKKNQDVILSVTRLTDSTCAKELVMEKPKKISLDLPLNKAVSLNLGKLAKGNVSFSCAMNMISGVINVE
jgi:plastocyanin domain-containing protein